MKYTAANQLMKTPMGLGGLRYLQDVGEILIHTGELKKKKPSHKISYRRIEKGVEVNLL